MTTERDAAVLLSTAAATDPEIRRMVWDRNARRTLEHLRDAGGFPGTASGDLSARLSNTTPADLRRQGEKVQARFIMPGDSEWPRSLADLGAHAPDEAPIGLWVRGHNLEELTRRAVAISGCKEATSYGSDITARIASALARDGVTVISGGSSGNESAAHRGALTEHRTIAVLGSGIDVLYPVINQDLFEAIIDNGALVSEAAPGARPSRRQATNRTRIIAALSTGAVVTEAPARSAALAIANWSVRLDRPVLAVPGPIGNIGSTGPHTLIRRGEAKLLAEPADALGLAGLPAVG